MPAGPLRRAPQSRIMGAMPTQKRSLYDILGIPQDAMSIDVGLAYQKRLAELQRTSPQDPSALSLLHEAHEVLSSPARRAAYDASLITAQEKATALEQAQSPDLVLEPEEGAEAGRRRIPPVGIALGIVAALIVIFFAWPSRSPPPSAPKPAEVVPPPPPPPPPQPMAAKDLLAMALPSVGRVQSFEMSGRAVPLGLAFAVEPDAMVTTCHGIPASSQLVVTVAGESHSATLTTTDELLDLCRLQVAAPALKPLPIASDDAKAGDAVEAIGVNAKGDFGLTEGRIVASMPDSRGPMLQLPMPVASEGSGAPVFDAFGKVVGVASTAQGHGAGVSIAAPASWLAQMRTRAAAR